VEKALAVLLSNPDDEDLVEITPATRWLSDEPVRALNLVARIYGFNNYLNI